MLRKLCTLAILTFIAFWTATKASPQCSNKISLVPLVALKAAKPPRNLIRYTYKLNASDSLFVLSHENADNSLGLYDTGFSISRNGTLLQHISLAEVPELQHEDADYQNSFSTIAIARTCGAEKPIFFLAMQYGGDITSPALIFAIAPSAHGYQSSPLPMISGGVVELSLSHPGYFRTWDNLHEGNCEACETAYEITEYEIRDAKPIRLRKYRTKHLYTSGNFDDRRRIRFGH